jgi:mannosyltransferase OCH1-like enzyme
VIHTVVTCQFLKYFADMKIGNQGFSPAENLAIPKQIKRTFPAVVAIVVLIVFLSTCGSMGSSTFFPAKTPYFPRKVWQTWKVDPLGFEEKDSTVARTWTQKNPSFRYEVLTDQNDMAYVDAHFGPHGFNRPDIVYVYRELTARIIKADLLRYLVMYVEGGVYTDIDVEALRSVEKFIPARYDERDIDMVIGVEIDQPEFHSHPILGKKCMSFCQWTFMCKPHLPVMMRLVENIIQWLKEVAVKQNVPLAEIQLDFDEVISGTGPSAFTKAILAEMSEREGREVNWDPFHALTESKLVGGILVLTVEAFAAGQGHSDSGNHNAKQALVKHHYHASGWPTAHPRYKHPIHGEVERCNWEAECVKIWDFNKATFEALAPEEQAAQVAIKQAEDAQLMQPQMAVPDMPIAMPDFPLPPGL